MLKLAIQNVFFVIFFSHIFIKLFLDNFVSIHYFVNPTVNQRSELGIDQILNRIEEQKGEAAHPLNFEIYCLVLTVVDNWERYRYRQCCGPGRIYII
jgi:hypothetical protein